MNLEIERKWLVNKNDLLITRNNNREENEIQKRQKIQQGYLDTYNPDTVVRVRIDHLQEKGWITIKKFVERGTSEEFEYEIPFAEASRLFEISDYSLTKERIVIKYKDQNFEVDFYDDLGFITAELELDSMDQKIEIPDWCGKEITGDKKYSNYYLAKNN